MHFLNAPLYPTVFGEWAALSISFSIKFGTMAPLSGVGLLENDSMNNALDYRIIILQFVD